MRVIDEDGQALGIMNVRDALALAQQKGLDLIEVAPTAQPPVCKIGDYGRIKYEQTKREREQHRKQRQQGEVKDVRIDPRSGLISDHDLQIKVKHIVRFLQEGNKVKVTFRFIGRGITRPELGKQTMDRILEQVSEIAQVERPPIMEGKQLIMVLSPKIGG